MSSAASTPNIQPLRSALKVDDDSERATPSGASAKGVQIIEPAPEPESSGENLPKKQFSAGVGKRLSARPPSFGAASSRSSLLSQVSLEGLSGQTSNFSPTLEADDSAASGPSGHHHHHHRHHLEHAGERFLAQVAEWLDHERVKKQNRKARKVHTNRRKSPAAEKDGPSSEQSTRHRRTYSVDSESSDVSFDRLQRILDDSMSALGLNAVPRYSPYLGKKVLHKKRPPSLHRAVSSDTDWQDGDILVPSCDAVLDNSKTMSYSGGDATPTGDSESISSRRDKERNAWLSFKNEIIKVAHTLKIKGWRRVPLDGGDKIGVQRLSGALTNAVYVVTPPDDLLRTPEPGRKPPAKLLLRVYGPQVENIIDRANELSVLRRLARKKIGPRLLGTFENGRFEQFFNAITLTPAHLREPETSKQIAKRMRELHDGIELLEEEKDAGPGVWRNWDHWLDNTARVITYLDKKLQAGDLGPVRGPGDAWKTRGLVLGVEWAKFKETVDKYRAYLDMYYNDFKKLREQLVFAHNDTQYGNILRIRPDDEKSPLMKPQNEHKQLIVIDFEYAAANVRGLEFANHFTEWTYNYHESNKPYACNPYMYPKPEEQYRFIRAYVEHRPQFPHPGSTPNLTPLETPTGTPQLLGTTPSTSSIADFMLDARVPAGGWREEERKREEHIEHEIKELMEETRLWRIANSAQWVAWGLMQAKVPGLDDTPVSTPTPATCPTSAEILGEEVRAALPAAVTAPEEEEQGDADEFDYLGYAQERALFFWGDCVQMGFVKLEEFPEGLRERIRDKMVEY